MENKELRKKEYNILDIASKIGSLLIPIFIFYFGYRIQRQQALDNENNQKQQAIYNASQQNIDRIASLLKSLSSSNPEERKLAVIFAKTLASDNTFPQELLPIMVYITNTDSAYASGAYDVIKTVRSSAQNSKDKKLISRIDTEISQSFKEKDLNIETNARMDIFYNGEKFTNSKPFALKISKILKEKYPNYSVNVRLLPHLINSQKEFNFTQSEIRCDSSQVNLAEECASMISIITSTEKPVVKLTHQKNPYYLSLYITNH
jgi:hypothetical protein